MIAIGFLGASLIPKAASFTCGLTFKLSTLTVINSPSFKQISKILPGLLVWTWTLTKSLSLVTVNASPTSDTEDTKSALSKDSGFPLQITHLKS